jgi:hypothetical protein
MSDVCHINIYFVQIKVCSFRTSLYEVCWNFCDINLGSVGHNLPHISNVMYN